ncbi:MAG TPA: Holliday junction resolvase RecU [Candidatus Scybalocola faecigallinarum]|uniref:Holliday junction resolvase RecU n=1 Tax=Candidatus Scybalocola faecigallinarum TaxID=2840941 RepID=A0A9D1JQV6_9FIRM|nr:Holliday junction resolvase RecU [Candidatus Scybalocola faecigallinarum]
MATWNSRGLRGSELEEMVNLTNERYRAAGLALIQKIPTPIKPINIDKQSRHITLAYFEQRSTVDYIGAVQGIPVCFDAKECHAGAFPIANVHEHQVVFMEDFERQGGVAFLLIYFARENKYYYMRFKELVKFWNRSKTGHAKSVKFTELDMDYMISVKGYYIQYLPLLQKDLDSRDEQQTSG